jgi:uncharacterized protein with gpF-like domain
MEEVFSDRIINEGFASRAFFVVESKPRFFKWDVTQLDEEQRKAKQSLVDYVKKLTTIYGEVHFTKEANDVMQAVVAENVGLIKSIPEKYLTDVQGEVMRHIQVGGSIESLADKLGPKIDLALIRRGRKIGEDDKSLAARVRKRAIFIATDQTNKAHATMTRMRQIEIGCNKAIWLHSHAVRHPRKEHLEFDHHEYDVRKGAFLEGKWVWPGTEINCKCRSLTILPDKDILRGYE